METRWLDRISARTSPSHSDGLPGSSRAAAVAVGPDYASGGPWMNLYPGYRIHWRDRQAEQEDPPAKSTPLPPQTDILDSAALPTAAQAP